MNQFINLIPKSRSIIFWLAAAGFWLSPFALGVHIAQITITPAAICFGIAFLFTLIERAAKQRQVIPLELVTIPAVLTCLVYFAIGLFSGIFAENTLAYAKEVLQRTVIIVFPLYLFALGPRTLHELRDILINYLLVGWFLAAFVLSSAIHLGFLQPVYFSDMEMHKNGIAASFAVMGVISLAGLLSSQVKFRKLFLILSYAIAFLGTVAAQGRAGIVSLVVATAVMLAVAGVKMRQIFLTVAGVILTIWAALAFVLPETVLNYVFSQEQHSSNFVRIMVWSQVFEYVSQHPFWAIGWGNTLHLGDNDILDTANVVLYDWMQLSLIGVLALIAVIFTSIALPVATQRKLNRFSIESFINLSALGIITARFVHAQLDVFWIGRGPTLTTFAALGMAIWISLFIKHNKTLNQGSGSQTKNILTTLRGSNLD